MHYFTMLTGLLATLLVFTPAGWAASQPIIEIVLGDRTVTLSRSELIQRADVTEIRIPRSSTYKQPMSYRALPLRACCATCVRGLTR